MAGRAGFLESEATAVQNICATNGCVYATRKPSCSIKYSEEVVMDFQEPDGCQVAAIDDDQKNYVIPGTMTSDGFTPFVNAPRLYPKQLEQTITTERRPSGQGDVRVIFKFRSDV